MIQTFFYRAAFLPESFRGCQQASDDGGRCSSAGGIGDFYSTVLPLPFAHPCHLPGQGPPLSSLSCGPPSIAPHQLLVVLFRLSYEARGVDGAQMERATLSVQYIIFGTAMGFWALGFGPWAAAVFCGLPSRVLSADASTIVWLFAAGLEIAVVQKSLQHAAPLRCAKGARWVYVRGRLQQGDRCEYSRCLQAK